MYVVCDFFRKSKWVLTITCCFVPCQELFLVTYVLVHAKFSLHLHLFFFFILALDIKVFYKLRLFPDYIEDW